MINILDDWRNPHQKFVFFDCETNGLNLLNSQAYQLSYITTKAGRIVDKVDDYIFYENFKMPAAAAAINRFDRSLYQRRAKPLAEVMQNFEANCKDSILVGHNVLNFDVFMLNVLFKNAKIDHDFWFMDRIIDTRALSTSFLTKRKNNNFDDWKDFLFWQASCLTIREKGLKSSQGFMLKHFSIPFEESRLHEALYDVEKNKEVFEKLLFSLNL